MKSALLFLILLLVIPACHQESVETSGSPIAPRVSSEQLCSQDTGNALDFDGKRKPDLPTIEELVIQNCYTVRDAVDAWARESGGDYPRCLTDESPLGNTLIDFLPNGRLLINPFTEYRTEPGCGLAAWRGETRYIGFMVVDGEPKAYTITGCGGSGDMIITITKYPEPEDNEADGKVVMRARKL